MRQLMLWKRCFIATLLISGVLLTQSALAETIVADNFALWTSGSALLNSLAVATSSPSGTFVAPRTTFMGSAGLQMRGLTSDFTLTGLQSLATFSAPYTITVLVTPLKGTANPFAIYAVSADLTQYLAVYANVNPVYEGFWANAPNVDCLCNLGEQFSPSFVPEMNTTYKIVMQVDATGTGTVKVYGAGKLLGTRADLQAGTGPAFLVIGQKIGLAEAGPQVADWSTVKVTTP